MILSSNLVGKLVFLFVITTLVPILISGYITFETSKSTLEKETLDKLETISQLKTQRIVENFEVLKEDMIAVTTYPDIQKHFPILKSHFGDWEHPEYLESKKILNEQLIQFEDAKSMVVDIMLINEDGKIVYNTNPDHGAKELGLLLPDPDQKAFSEGQKGTYIAQMFKNYLENFEPYMLLSTPIHDDDGNFLGLMTFELNMDLVFSIVADSSGLGDTGENIIATKTDTGVLFLSPLKNESGAVLNKEIEFNSSDGIAIQHAVRGEEFMGQTSDYAGVDVVAVGTYIPMLNWGMVSKIDSSEAFSSVAYLEQINSLLAIIFTVLVGIIGFIASKNIANPIIKLNKSAKSATSGDFSQSVSHSGSDELASFVTSFNHLLEKLKIHESQQQEYNTKLEELIFQLKQQDKAKSEFASMISHELKTPLTPILGWCQMLEQGIGGSLTEKQEHGLAQIKINSEKLQKLIQDILDLHKLELNQFSFSTSKFNVKELLTQIAEDFRTDKKENCPISVDSEEIVMTSDDHRISQIVTNFVTNALDFLPAKDPKIVLSAKSDGDYVRVSVKDNGIGIPEENQKNLFKKFYQVDTSRKRKHGGSGLGLSICKGITEGLGGTIGVSSKVGKGSEFYIRIPKRLVLNSNEFSRSQIDN
ncbi:sensor histidine kinase [Candidatus Nitrosopumilus sp. SW]|uniref:sensor histidine kinase n=1 Tax=Candidatus Nitrosopumilus sp. SW TaxID=2508726 RepID=UPI00115187B9|nr:sensor histidine kinase [Candidatus Nitrosopumilus sp. SW]QDI89305.1 sensor histidine kinase [Candidatus Nitrosopumilus sp. SW]